MKGYVFFCMVLALSGCDNGPVSEGRDLGMSLDPVVHEVPMEHRRGQGRRDYHHESINGSYDLYFAAAARRYMPIQYKADWHYQKSQAFHESALRADAESGVGAVGLAQFMAATWEEISHKYSIEGGRRNPKASIEAQAAYVSELLLKFYAPRPDLCRWRLAWSSYNYGPGATIREGRRQGWPECLALEPLPTETENYIVRIEDTIALLEGGF